MLRRVSAARMQRGMTDDNPIRVETCTGPALLPLLPGLQRLRAEVFRTWPYLYNGDPAQEISYMRELAQSPSAAIVVAWSGQVPVGMATCLPLVDESANIRAPFEAARLQVERFFYFGESVLLPPWRGRGIGVRFFAGREAQAVARGADFACFCAVVRSDTDSRQPVGHVPLDAFWGKRGYRPMPGLTCMMRWREVGDAAESDHRLQFWGKALGDAALP